MVYNHVNTLKYGIYNFEEEAYDEAFRVSFKFPKCGWDQRIADFNRFARVETRSCYSCLVLYLHN